METILYAIPFGNAGIGALKSMQTGGIHGIVVFPSYTKSTMEDDEPWAL
jgi:hypothetical protein